MKQMICTICGLVGSTVASFFGGWTSGMTTLLIFMFAGIFKKSKKTESGALESHAGWKGLCRKGVTLLIVLVACRLDMTIGTTFIKDATVIGFIVNETISLIENAGLMGIPIPKAIEKGIDVLKNKEEVDE